MVYEIFPRSMLFFLMFTTNSLRHRDNTHALWKSSSNLSTKTDQSNSPLNTPGFVFVAGRSVRR
jgi:hypothetical protein